MENRFENFTITVLKINKLVQKIKLFEIDGYGLKAVHVMCVHYLNRRALTAGELCRLTCEDKAAISRALVLLREKGYIEYDAGGYNAAISLTEKGKELASYITCRAESAVKAGGEGLSNEERCILYKSLGSIESNLEKYYSLLIQSQNENK